MRKQFIRVDIEFAGARQRRLRNSFEFIEINISVLNEKYNIVNIRVEAAIQLAERNAVWVGDEDFQIPKSPDADISFAAPRRNGNKSLHRYRIHRNLQFLGDLDNGPG